MGTPFQLAGFHVFFDGIGHGGGRLETGQTTGLAGHGQQFIALQTLQTLRQRRGRHLGLRQVHGGTMLGHVLGVVALVCGGRHHQGDQHAGHASGAQLADGDGAGAANDDVAIGQALRHVVDEGQHLGIHGCRVEAGLPRSWP
jgi:hypothetical protein